MVKDAGKTYSNRFASMEKQADGTWIVFSEVSGLPIYINPDAAVPKIKFFDGYVAARTAMLEMTEHYKAILG